jgi:hypothetical protein
MEPRSSPENPRITAEDKTNIGTKAGSVVPWNDHDFHRLRRSKPLPSSPGSNEKAINERNIHRS